MPQDTPVPAGTQVTLTGSFAATELALTAVAELGTTPRGFHVGGVAVDMELFDRGGAAGRLGGEATVCLPVAEGGGGRVYRNDGGSEWRAARGAHGGVRPRGRRAG